ncbi:MAG TPA: BamA/TamA family outer membrane protein, partial [Polyangiales bacterium]
AAGAPHVGTHEPADDEQPPTPDTSSPPLPAQQRISEERTAVAAYDSTQAAEPSELLPVAPAPDAPTKRLWDIVKVLPILFYSPETSAGFGAGTLFQFRMPGAVGERRPSAISLGGVYTLHKQVMGQFTPELRFGDDDYVLKLDVLGAKYPNRFYGIGNDPRDDLYDKYTDCYLRGELDFRVRPFSRESFFGSLYLGGHYSSAWSNIHDVRPGERGDPSMFAQINDPGERPVFSSGFGPTLAWDSRDGINWPRGGSFIELRATAYEPWMGSDVSYRRLLLDARRYQPLWLDHILAMRFVSQTVWGDVPFQRLPQLGGAGLFRGWFSGQLRGKLLIAVEAEYRVPIGPRFAAVLFGSAGRVAEERRSMSLKDLRVAGGGGLRVSVDRRDRVNIRLDLAYGDSFYPYLQFREAF